MNMIPALLAVKLADAGEEIVAVRIVEYNLIQFELVLPHGLEGNSLSRLGGDENLASCPPRAEILWESRQIAKP